MYMSESLGERELLWEQVLPNFHVLFSKHNTPPINSRMKISRDLILGKVVYIFITIISLICPFVTIFRV